MEAPATRNPDAQRAKYGIFRRARAFVRGLINREPLLEVALEGFRGGYSLPPRLEARYRLRIERSMGRNGSKERYARMLREGCAVPAQLLISALYAKEFREKMESVSGLQKAGQGMRHHDIMAKGGKAATELTRIRGIAADLISCGAITSRDAMLELAPMMLHNDFFEATFITHSKVFHAQLRRLLDSSNTPQELRTMIEGSIERAKCPMCADELRTAPGQK